MKRISYPAEVDTLIAQLKRLPGIGGRSAERIALWLIQSKDAHPELLTDAVTGVKETIKPCTQCGFFASSDLCEICSDPQRDQTVLCVVEQPTDILPIERSGAYRGLYHSLGGRISPLDNVAPGDLRIDALLSRTKDSEFQEVILALNSDVEGEATANYLAELMKELSVKITRIAQGLPAGAGLDHADALTLNRALSHRRQMDS